MRRASRQGSVTQTVQLQLEQEDSAKTNSPKPINSSTAYGTTASPFQLNVLQTQMSPVRLIQSSLSSNSNSITMLSIPNYYILTHTIPSRENFSCLRQCFDMSSRSILVFLLISWIGTSSSVPQFLLRQARMFKLLKEYYTTLTTYATEEKESILITSTTTVITYCPRLHPPILLHLFPRPNLISASGPNAPTIRPSNLPPT